MALELARQEFARREKEKLSRRGTQSSKFGDREVERVSAPPTPITESVKNRYSQLRQQYVAYPGSRDHERRERDRASGEFDLQKQMQALNLQATSLHNEHGRRDPERRDPERQDPERRGPERRDPERRDLERRDLERRDPEKRERGNRNSDRSNKDTVGGGTGRGWVYDYPTVPRRSKGVSLLPAPLPQLPPSLITGANEDYSSRTPPPLPPLPESMRTNNASVPPPVPRKMPLPAPQSPQTTPQSSLPSLPTLPTTLTNSAPPPPLKLPAELTDPQPVKRTTSKNYQFGATARLENGDRLRTIFLPANLRHKFLDIAYPNTRRNLETCGVLCGTLIQNALFITRLVIPEQEVTSDTCDMKDEEELFKYVDGEDLMVLGWIHTHPMYECFMSSVDLHNHCAYQLMLPESVAVVCAPRYEPSLVSLLTCLCQPIVTN